jgi:hypothetical protein
VTLLYNFWHERRGLQAPGRGNRPERKRRETPLYKRIVDLLLAITRRRSVETGLN